jgi:predicted lactoylglutathione lyase
MKKKLLLIFAVTLSFGFGFFVNVLMAKSSENANLKALTNSNKQINKNMKLGAFSISLNVKNIEASKLFYENLGFSVLAGDFEKKYFIMKNENALIGIFQGMFENNILTFNPGWDENGNNTNPFDDIRTIQKNLKAKGAIINPETDEKTTGPASFMITDPDGNVLLFDQHR